MTEKEKRKIWCERSQGAKLEELAKRFGISEHEVIKILEQAPQVYQRAYYRAGRISETAFSAYPPRKKMIRHEETGRD